MCGPNLMVIHPIVVETPVCSPHLTCCFLSGLSSSEVRPTGKAPNVSVNWSCGDGGLEEISTSTGRRKDSGTLSRLCRRSMFARWQRLQQQVGQRHSETGSTEPRQETPQEAQAGWTPSPAGLLYKSGCMWDHEVEHYLFDQLVNIKHSTKHKQRHMINKKGYSYRDKLITFTLLQLLLLVFNISFSFLCPNFRFFYPILYF